MAASSSAPLSNTSQEAFRQFYTQVQNLQNTNRDNLRSKLERLDRAYQREQDLTKENHRAKQANRSGDSDRFQNVTVPVVMPQVEAATAHPAGRYAAGELFVHPDAKLAVHMQIVGFNPMRRDNTDGLLDLLTYAPKVVEEFAEYIIASNIIESQEFDALEVLDFNSPF